MARMLGVGVVALTTALSGKALADDGEAAVVHLRVESALVRPLKGDGRFWDGLHEKDLPKLASSQVQAEITRIVKKQLLRVGANAPVAAVAAAVAVFAGKRLNEWSTPPDPFGELAVDGRVASALPLAQNRLDPSWPAHKAHYVRLAPGATVELRLVDADLSGAHDPIGTCRFEIDGIVEGNGRSIIGERCTGDLLAASVVAERAPPPLAVHRGTYRVVAARAGANATKPDGRPWDPAGVGDPQIQINVDGRWFACPVNHGQRAATCAPENLTFELTDQTTIALRVVEVDALLNDAIGTASVGGLLGKKSGSPISMTATDSVDWAEVVIERVERADNRAP